MNNNLFLHSLNYNSLINLCFLNYLYLNVLISNIITGVGASRCTNQDRGNTETKHTRLNFTKISAEINSGG